MADRRVGRPVHQQSSDHGGDATNRPAPTASYFPVAEHEEAADRGVVGGLSILRSSDQQAVRQPSATANTCIAVVLLLTLEATSGNVIDASVFVESSGTVVENTYIVIDCELPPSLFR